MHINVNNCTSALFFVNIFVRKNTWHFFGKVQVSKPKSRFGTDLLHKAWKNASFPLKYLNDNLISFFWSKNLPEKTFFHGKKFLFCFLLNFSYFPLDEINPPLVWWLVVTNLLYDEIIHLPMIVGMTVFVAFNSSQMMIKLKLISSASRICLKQ